MLQFNLRGLLIPETIIPSTLDELETEFVAKLNEETRPTLFVDIKNTTKI